MTKAGRDTGKVVCQLSLKMFVSFRASERNAAGAAADDAPWRRGGGGGPCGWSSRPLRLVNGAGDTVHHSPRDSAPHGFD
jgi:hypothetical protein